MTLRSAYLIPIVAILVGLVARFLLAWQPVYNFDMGSYVKVARIVHEGGNVYAQTSRYNYSPVWFNVLGLLSFVPLAFPFVVRAFVSLVDIINGYLILRIFGTKSAVIYWLSPVAIIISGFHGQFDTLSATPILVALAFVTTPHSRFSWQTGILSAVAILIKHLIMFSAWTLLVYRYGVRKAIGFFVFAMCVFAASFVPYLSDGGFDGIVNHVILYHSIPVMVGLGVLPSFLSYPIFLIAMLSVPFVAQRLNFDEHEALGLSAIALLVFIPGTSPQYWILVSLFGLALVHRLGRWYAVYTLVTTLTLVVVYVAFVSIIPSEFVAVLNMVWLLCLIALILLFKDGWPQLRTIFSRRKLNSTN